jgi:AcrR family transcriptional regulator
MPILVRMNAVAETAGVALGTLYRNFPSKAELMVEVVAEVAEREVDVAAKSAMEAARPPNACRLPRGFLQAGPCWAGNWRMLLSPRRLSQKLSRRASNIGENLLGYSKGLSSGEFVTENFLLRTFKPLARALSARFSKASLVP